MQVLEEDHDYEKIQAKQKIKELKSLPILFSDKVKKINGMGVTQERTFVITAEKIWNVSGKSIKRSIDLEAVGGVSINT